MVREEAQDGPETEKMVGGGGGGELLRKTVSVPVRVLASQLPCRVGLPGGGGGGGEMGEVEEVGEV